MSLVPGKPGREHFGGHVFPGSDCGFPPRSIEQFLEHHAEQDWLAIAVWDYWNECGVFEGVEVLVVG